MKKVVSVALLVSASLTQIAYGNEPESSPKGASPFFQSSIAQKTLQVAATFIGDVGSSVCPAGTARSSAGDCQPPIEFD
ncbi:hypothetical protein [Pseudomonas sp. CCOS 191]|uniref:hypothetical protein n=1 Tax=Pseudomonas sp. CCOS 191 TaxID=1649877 RepID=UPI0018E69DD7|nr:hypothetical protein [Pseudomonas sp. CCOS 191]MBI6952852.1 hypothetical protein [Pseudomonas sp. CCOS 191]